MRARATIELLLDEIGDDEQHPLAEVLDYLTDRVAAWEDEHTPIPVAASLDIDLTVDSIRHPGA